MPLDQVDEGKSCIVIWSVPQKKTEFKISFTSKIVNFFFVKEFIAAVLDSKVKFFERENVQLAHIHDAQNEVFSSAHYYEAKNPAKSFLLITLADKSILIRRVTGYIP